MKIYKLFASIMLVCFVIGSSPALAQGGDQILDGIGETALIARYTLMRDANDRSRNNYNASVYGPDINFINDSLFWRVLYLPGNNDSYISIPGEALEGEESLSITVWVKILLAKSGQVLFDFGKNGGSHFFAATGGINDNEGFQVYVLRDGEKYVTVSPPLKINKWNHLAVVFTPPSES